MFRTMTAPMALALLALPVSAGAQSGAYYSATLATASTQAKRVTRNTVWNCSETVCSAAKSTSRDQIMCELLARQTGEIVAFSANGDAFDAEALARCNARAR